MKWRERVQAARERGTFSVQDRRDVGEWGTCMVGEARQILVEHGLDEVRVFFDEQLKRLGVWGLPNTVKGPIHATLFDDFDLADRLLDAIEDRMLELKRGE